MSTSILNSTSVAKRDSRYDSLQPITSIPDRPPSHSIRMIAVEGSLGVLGSSDTDLAEACPLEIRSGQNAIAAITEHLLDNDVRELHLIAHGAPGFIQIGSGITSVDLIACRHELAKWDLDSIVIWSCDVAQDPNFIAQFQEFTGSKVFATQGRLGLGETLSNSNYPLLEQKVSGLTFHLHTNSVGFDVQDASSGTPGLFDVSVFYGTYHYTNGFVEGALSLYEPKDGFRIDSEGNILLADYSVESYGRNGINSPSVNGYGMSAWRHNNTVGDKTNANTNGSDMLPSEVVQSGFTPGQDYWVNDSANNLNSDVSKAYNFFTGRTDPAVSFQVATIKDVKPGNYRADYDNDPVGFTNKNNLTFNYSTDAGFDAIGKMTFYLDSSGEVSLGAETSDISIAEGELKSIDLDEKITGENYEVSLGNLSVLSNTNTAQFQIPPIALDDENTLSEDAQQGFDYLNL